MQKRKNESSQQIVEPSVDVTKLTDSCSYTIDGVTYTCDRPYSNGRGSAGANLDTSNGGWKWDADTLLYSAFYQIGYSSIPNSTQGGNLKITLVKKFGKNQLKPSAGIWVFRPVSDTLLYYPKGQRLYAVDYDRFNSQNGVVLQVMGNTGNMRTYSYKPVSVSTAISNGSQKDSKFEITNVYWVPASDGWLDRHILEAKFTATVFDNDERPHRLENGYLRLHVE